MSYTKADLENVFRLGIVTCQKWRKEHPDGAPMDMDDFRAAFKAAMAHVRKLKELREV